MSAPTVLLASTAAPRVKVPVWAGRAVTAVPVLFLGFDIVIKLLVIQPVVEAMLKLGYEVRLAPVIGAIELACLAVYLVPRTAAFGAVLLTGFLGGAVAIHLRVGDPLFSHILFPVYVGALLWIGLLLRRPGLRALVRRAGA